MGYPKNHIKPHSCIFSVRNSYFIIYCSHLSIDLFLKVAMYRYIFSNIEKYRYCPPLMVSETLPSIQIQCFDVWYLGLVALNPFSNFILASIPSGLLYLEYLSSTHLANTAVWSF